MAIAARERGSALSSGSRMGFSDERGVRESKGFLRIDALSMRQYKLPGVFVTGRLIPG